MYYYYYFLVLSVIRDQCATAHTSGTDSKTPFGVPVGRYGSTLKTQVVVDMEIHLRLAYSALPMAWNRSNGDSRPIALFNFD